MDGQVNWRKSSYSGYNGNCVEVAADWEKSSYCEGGACVEIARGGHVLVRDSKDPAGPVLEFSTPEWRAFVESYMKRAVPTNQADLSGVPLGELARRGGAAFSSAI